MEQNFWLEMWQLNQIGFHEEEINPHLQCYWPDFRLAKQSKVFVPLCGKSKDMLWLMQQSHEVFGVELSPIAVSAFFAENELSATFNEHEASTVSQQKNLKIFCSDFFSLSVGYLPRIDAVYDRAALVALPPEMRIRYVNHLRSFLKPRAKILLITLEYSQQEMTGPPFSVPEQEVTGLYGDWCDISLLCSEDILDTEPRFRERGLSGLREQVYALTVNN